ncbi:uncharacterized protein RHOBADRAFT_43972 [Rhodotorula graminis WP1]|uniref:Uncharacterized protein n=1 Tax=Rhodotorula graminis (strain WP1) TaxID=578459 RepID=A0A194S4F9_RHOGW|nr:uncharacterized protein RHOBADRAFT_43972 [Rhodotorula graminis WP1]KPV75467.1 hypothetical protein RHOBADRAFT_43972 [Rhodotorula graminis WP1]
MLLPRSARGHPRSALRLLARPAPRAARAGLPALVDSWTRITTVADRLAHRRLNQGKEYEALHDALERAVEVEGRGWRPKEVEQTEREVRATSGVAADVAETEGASARRSLESVVEELKQYGENCASLRGLDGRHAAVGSDSLNSRRSLVTRSPLFNIAPRHAIDAPHDQARLGLSQPAPPQRRPLGPWSVAKRSQVVEADPAALETCAVPVAAWQSAGYF